MKFTLNTPYRAYPGSVWGAVRFRVAGGDFVTAPATPNEDDPPPPGEFLGFQLREIGTNYYVDRPVDLRPGMWIYEGDDDGCAPFPFAVVMTVED